jgi:adenylate cyclase class 2
MRVINVEIKAKSGNQDRIREILKECNADFRGTDHQVDTYFSVSAGRLKLREGEIENNLIYYERPDESGPRPADALYIQQIRIPHLSESLKIPWG